MSQIKNILTIAGSDSGGGAGVQADIKTISALGCYSLSVVTAVTSQNTQEVNDIHEIPPGIVRSQCDAVFKDIRIDAVKIGMIFNTEIIQEVAKALRIYAPKFVVLDPVMVSTTGSRLMIESAIEDIKNTLLPLSTIVTPNIPEASLLLGKKIDSYLDMKKASEEMLGFKSKYVLIKGGHLKNTDLSKDILTSKDEEAWFSSDRIKTKNTHGTGCTFSSAIACFLAMGVSPQESVGRAKKYIYNTILHSTKLSVGEGSGPVHHFYKHW